MDLRPSAHTSRLGWIALGGSAVAGLALGLVVFRAPGEKLPAGAAPTVPSVPAPVVGAPAPDFELAAVDGENLRLSELRGKVVVLNFWATWCPPCRLEMPDLQERADTYPNELAVVGVDFDESAEEVAAFAKDVGVRFPLLLDPGGKVQSLYRVSGYPTTFFIDPEGTIRAQHVGLMSGQQIDEYLRQLELAS